MYEIEPNTFNFLAQVFFDHFNERWRLNKMMSFFFSIFNFYFVCCGSYSTKASIFQYNFNHHIFLDGIMNVNPNLMNENFGRYWAQFDTRQWQVICSVGSNHFYEKSKWTPFASTSKMKDSMKFDWNVIYNGDTSMFGLCILMRTVSHVIVWKIKMA